jgi:hypothetical protein
MGKSQVSQLENAGSVKELAGRLQALDIDGVYVGKQFLHGLRGNGSAARVSKRLCKDSFIQACHH